MSKVEGVEPVIKLLCVLMVFFSLVLLFCEYVFPEDGQLFQVFSGVLTGFTGAILMRVKPPNGERSSSDNSTTIIGSKVVEQPKA